MRNTITILFFSLLTCAFLQAQERYIDEVFTDVTILEDQSYSVNVTVQTGAPVVDTLCFDLYLPVGDTVAKRPLAVVLHTGTFFPRGAVAPTGDKDDYACIESARRLALRGYVAASIEYRKGWNPLAPTDIERRATIINAAYRSIQDLYAFLRFMNMTVDDLGNPYSLDMGRVALFGIGTGGFVATNAAALNRQEEIYIDKFRNPVDGTPFIDTLIVGDLHGIKPAAINVPNHVGYNDDFHFAFGLDGGLGDSSWIEDGGSIPLVAAGIVDHPTTPYGIDPISGEINCDLPVFTGAGTGIFVVNIAGTACIIQKANALGFNDPLNAETYDDPVSEALRGQDGTFGQEHLWAINLPGQQAGAWEFWDSTFWSMVPDLSGNFPNVHLAGLNTNPDMSMEKANRYLDTALWFFAPRAYTALDLAGLTSSIFSPPKVDQIQFGPNPTGDMIYVHNQEKAVRLNLMNNLGQQVLTYRSEYEQISQLDISHLPPGIYYLGAFDRSDTLIANGRIIKQ